MLTKEEIANALQQNNNLSEGTDYNVMLKSKLSTVITLNALNALIEKFGEEPLKEAHSAGVFNIVRSIDFDMEI